MERISHIYFATNEPFLRNGNLPTDVVENVLLIFCLALEYQA